MAFLNTQEREAFQQELTDIGDFIKVKRRLILADQKGRLAFFRNAQHSGQLETRYDLEGLGTRVTIIEKHDRELDKSGKFWNSSYEIKDIVVEALPENRL
ncbi:MAG: hypothetical protein AAF787_17470 [Chloroflexota bacterium]